MSNSTKNWGTPVSGGSFNNNEQLQEIRFDQPVSGRYIRFVAKGEWTDAYYASMAEIDVMAVRE